MKSLITRARPGCGRASGLIAALLFAVPAVAQNFLAVEYDPESDALVMQIAYRGTHPGHSFALRWDECKTRDDGSKAVSALVADDQWDDLARQEYQVTERFSLEEMPCRPAVVTLHTAAGFAHTVRVPAAPQSTEDGGA